MSELGAFQREFVRALFHEGIRTPGVTVHRNTVIKGLVDALQANYPTVVQLVGDEWFRACAAVYVRQSPPATAVLASYGAGFPGFLSDFPPAAELPYLAEVARIDRLHIEAYAARDAPSLTHAVLARLSPAALFEQRLTLHPAVRYGQFRHSAVTIWQYHRSDVREAELAVDDRIESALITRPDATIECTPLESAAFAFLEQIRCGATLGEAGMAALEIDPNADVASYFAQLIARGAFAELEGSPS
jgi:hypothetical protein